MSGPHELESSLVSGMVPEHLFVVEVGVEGSYGGDRVGCPFGGVLEDGLG